MTIIDALLLFIFSIMISAVGRILGEDAKTFIPRICRSMILRSSKILDEKYAARYEEEWLYHLNKRKELFGMLAHACGILFLGARRTGRIVGFNRANCQYNKIFKRMMDVTFAIALLLYTLPIFIITYLTIVISDGGPAFYRQQRIGRGGKPFAMFSFRTMRFPEPEKVLTEHLDANSGARAEPKKHQRLPSSSYITRPGIFLRRTRINELPILLNILRGDMSFVGPVPKLPETQKEENEQEQIANHNQMRPGITGFWAFRISAHKQASESQEEADKRYDKANKRYDNEVSFFTDLKIIGLTIAIVIAQPIVSIFEKK